MDDRDSSSAAGQPGQELETVSDARTTPLPRECVACFVRRMLYHVGCNATLRWARHWRNLRAPRATSLDYRLARLGGCCDCELFLNVWVPIASAQQGAEPRVRSYPSPRGICAGVRLGSSQPCASWGRRRR
jgi:hypothetical protein